jgi:CRISPR system Cascade subunit CasC
MFVEVHLIQSFVPSNLNRDDLGNPKECEFGGVRRARISSQCLKRAIRTAEAFKATTEVEESIRTRYLTRKIVEGLTSADRNPEDVTRIARVVAAVYSSKKKQMDSSDPNRTRVAVYLSAADVNWLTEQLAQQWEAVAAASVEDEVETEDDKDTKSKRGKKGKSVPPAIDTIVNGLIERTTAHTDAPDIALFGRMLADRPETNVDAACQVAHAISTHAVKAQTDFFTAVDTLLKPDETGAAMMDYANFNSACFYRYTRLDWEQLVNNLKSGQDPITEEIDLARRTVDGFLRAMVEAIPTGKINAHGQNNPPSFLLAVVRSGGMAWSLANAFERPIHADHDGLVMPSVKALDRYWGRLRNGYGDKTLRRVVVWPWGDDYPLEALEPARDDPLQIQVANLDAWVEAVTKELFTGEA